MERSLIKQLRGEFNVWCSMLSLDEIASNQRLLRTIERIEKQLVRAEVKALAVGVPRRRPA